MKLQRIQIYFETSVKYLSEFMSIYNTIYRSGKNVCKLCLQKIEVCLLLKCTLLQPILLQMNPTAWSYWEKESNWQSPQHMSGYKPKIKSPPYSYIAGLHQSTLPCQRSWHRKKFWRKVDKKAVFFNFFIMRDLFAFLVTAWYYVFEMAAMPLPLMFSDCIDNNILFYYI